MTDINNRDQQMIKKEDLSGPNGLVDEMVHINKQEIPIGSMGENLSSDKPFYPGLKKLEVILPEDSKAGSESAIFKRFMTNKMIGHGFAYEDLERYGYHLEVESTSVVTGDGITTEYMGVTKDITTLDMPEADGSIGHYTPITIKTKNPGVIAQVLYSAETHEIKVVFRGTSDAATLAADIEIGGPGAESFADDANTILEQVNEIAGKIGATKVSVSGHSLGGALSQLFVTRLTDAQAQNQGLREQGEHHIPANIRNHLAKIMEVQADVFNAAGVSTKVCDRIKATLSYLKSRQPNFKMSMNYCLVGGDVVQQLYNKILVDADPNLALVTLLKLQNGYEGWGLPSSFAGAGAGAAVGMAVAGPVGGLIGGALGAAGAAAPAAKNTHCDSFYLNQNAQNREVGYSIATNETPKGKALIQKEVGNKTVLTDTLVANAVQSAVVTGGRGINRIVQTVKKAIVENVVNPIKNAISNYIVNPISSWWTRKPAEAKPIQPSVQSAKHSSTSPHARAQARVTASKLTATAATTQAAALPLAKKTLPAATRSAPTRTAVTQQAVCFQKQREDQTQKIANLELVQALQQKFYMAISPIEKSILSICLDAKTNHALNAKQLEALSQIGKKINALPYKMLNKELNLKEGVADVVGILKELTQFFKENAMLTTTLGPSIQESMKSLGYFLHGAFHEVAKDNLPADMKTGIKRGLDFMNTNFLELDTVIRKTMEESFASKVLMKNAHDTMPI